MANTLAGNIHEIVAPVYRYFVTDLLTNEVLMEIPFQGVSYERGLKGAGAFEGKIPAIPATAHLNLYDYTMPGQTALYVVRNNRCVWGGLIWARTLGVKDNVLSISGSEYPSYLHHRRIWKSWGHQFGASIQITGGTGLVVLDNGSTTALKVGASVGIDFLEQENLRYSNYYQIAQTPTPTTKTFTLDAVLSRGVANASRTNGVVSVNTSQVHDFNIGDVVTLSGTAGFDGTFTITTTGGVGSTNFTVAQVGADVPETLVSGTVYRTIPDGTYTGVTVTVQTDTYDYVRALTTAVFKDFVGIDFPNTFIQPGITYQLDITKTKLEAGYATITTATDHKLVTGQAVQISEVDRPFDGEAVLVSTPTPNTFQYALGGLQATTPRAVAYADIIARGLANGEVTMRTLQPHGYEVGQLVSIDPGTDIDGLATDLAGDWIITKVPDPTTFVYVVPSAMTSSMESLSQPTATVGGVSVPITVRALTNNVASIYTTTPSGFVGGNVVTIANLDVTVPIIEKSLDAARSLATITTSGPHNLTVSDSVTIAGVKDTAPVSKVQATTTAATFTTNPSHNFKVGDTVTVDNMSDVYTPIARSVSGNVVSLSLSVPHNISVGDALTVESITDQFIIGTTSITSNLATVALTQPHGFRVNDTVTIQNVPETASVVSKEIANGNIILTTSVPHNFQETQKITVSGIGGAYDGDFTVLSTTATRVIMEFNNDTITQALADAQSTHNTSLANELQELLSSGAPPSKASGTIYSPDSIFNQDFVLNAVSGNTIQFSVSANDALRKTPNGAIAATVTGSSPVNGLYTATAVPSSTQVQYALVCPDLAAYTIPYPDGDDTPKPSVSVPSIFTGTHTVSFVTRNTFGFNQTIPNAIALHFVDSGLVSANSIFNGTYTITSITPNTFQFAKSAVSNVLETVTTNTAYARNTVVFNGTYTITGIDAARNLFTFSKTHANIPAAMVLGYGQAAVRPKVTVASAGPYPGNSDLDIGFSDNTYSGVNVAPADFRSFQLTNAGEALDSYADGVDGFEYRIDCLFDEETRSFSRKLVLIPINFPNPPPEGEASPPERFGADRLVFEYPGSIIDIEIEESAENSSTRFFASGSSSLGEDAGVPYSVASNTDLLNGTVGERRWPLLDDTASIENIEDKTVLYAYAKRYLAEGRPPGVTLTVSVNGSIGPDISSFQPGDWCSLIVDNDFIKMRLKSRLEPRDTVLVRKIDSYKVTVPDGVTFPETIELTLVAETEVDKIV